MPNSATLIDIVKTNRLRRCSGNLQVEICVVLHHLFPSRTFRIHTAVLTRWIEFCCLFRSLHHAVHRKRRYNPTLRPAPLPPPILRASANHRRSTSPLPQSLPGQMARPIEYGNNRPSEFPSNSFFIARSASPTYSMSLPSICGLTFAFKIILEHRLDFARDLQRYSAALCHLDRQVSSLHRSNAPQKREIFSFVISQSVFPFGECRDVIRPNLCHRLKLPLKFTNADVMHIRIIRIELAQVIVVRMVDRVLKQTEYS